MNLVIETSKIISNVLEESIKKQEITIGELFDENYIPISGTNPQQYTTKFLIIILEP